MTARLDLPQPRWVRFADSAEWIIGQSDASGGYWTIIGSDCLYAASELIIGDPVIGVGPDFLELLAIVLRNEADEQQVQATIHPYKRFVLQLETLLWSIWKDVESSGTPEQKQMKQIGLRLLDSMHTYAPKTPKTCRE